MPASWKASTWGQGRPRRVGEPLRAPCQRQMPKSFGHKWLDGPFSVALGIGPLDLAHLHSDRELEDSATGFGSQVDWDPSRQAVEICAPRHHRAVPVAADLPIRADNRYIAGVVGRHVTQVCNDEDRSDKSVAMAWLIELVHALDPIQYTGKLHLYGISFSFGSKLFVIPDSKLNVEPTGPA